MTDIEVKSADLREESPWTLLSYTLIQTLPVRA